jgi:hypothetical protein
MATYTASATARASRCLLALGPIQALLPVVSPPPPPPPPPPKPRPGPGANGQPDTSSDGGGGSGGGAGGGSGASRKWRKGGRRGPVAHQGSGDEGSGCGPGRGGCAAGGLGLGAAQTELEGYANRQRAREARLASAALALVDEAQLPRTEGGAPVVAGGGGDAPAAARAWAAREARALLEAAAGLRLSPTDVSPSRVAALQALAGGSAVELFSPDAAGRRGGGGGGGSGGGGKAREPASLEEVAAFVAALGEVLERSEAAAAAARAARQAAEALQVRGGAACSQRCRLVWGVWARQPQREGPRAEAGVLSSE